MTEKQQENFSTQLVRIEERVKADRRATTIYHQHLNDELDEIKMMLKQHFADSDIKAIQFSHVVKKVDDLAKDADTASKELTDYKAKMRYWEVFQEWRKLPFWSFMAIFAIIARREISLLLNNLIDKFSGQ